MNNEKTCKNIFDKNIFDKNIFINLFIIFINIYYINNIIEEKINKQLAFITYPKYMLIILLFILYLLSNNKYQIIGIMLGFTYLFAILKYNINEIKYKMHSEHFENTEKTVKHIF